MGGKCKIQDVEKLRHYARTHNVYECAGMFNVTSVTIKNYSKKYNFPIAKKSFYITDRNRQLIDYYTKKQVTLRQTAKVFYMTESNVKYILNKNGIKVRNLSEQVKNIIYKLDYTNMTIPELYNEVIRSDIKIDEYTFRTIIYSNKIPCIRLKSKIREKLYRVDTASMTLDEIYKYLDYKIDKENVRSFLNRNKIPFKRLSGGRPRGIGNVHKFN